MMAAGMNGFIAVTDYGWYEKLSRASEPRDANFWRPSTKALRRLDVGTPFIFKLKKPHDAIAGFGFFAGFSVLPDWLAWETFGEANGVDDLEALRARLHRIREGARIEADLAGRIGCCLIAEARFFPPERWLAPPRDWGRTTQTGDTYDLATGEGLRIWQDCLALAAMQAEPAPRWSVPEGEDRGRYGELILYRPRLGQGIFRVQVLDAYGRACAITGEHSLPVLEAAHIKPYALGGMHDVKNGLALRSDLHRLFDRNYITIDEHDCLLVGDRLMADYGNGRSYKELRGARLNFPKEPWLRPTPEALAWHREHFLG
jgi:putative restriction endonuclease